MTLLLSILGALSLLELTIWLPFVWGARKAIAIIIIPSISVTSGLIVGMKFQFWAAILLMFSLYRVVNLLRLLEDRMQPDHLFSVTRRTSMWLIGCQVITVGVAQLSLSLSVSSRTWLYAVAGMQLGVALVLFFSTIRHLRATRAHTTHEHLAERDLPTLSVLIPARNETTDLEACLSSLVSSDYPKLEILVLDDCSQNKRTAGIIKDFAHSGVRFIAGTPPPKHWLAKNHAYEQLANEASGEILLFCGVDTRFSPHSLRSIIDTMLAKDKQMASLIPRNSLPRPTNLEAAFIQPARYAWELAIPRRWLRRTPVLSTCWLITKRQLSKAGGLPAVSNSVSPEAYFARYSAKHGDKYSFLQSGTTIDLSSDKRISEQRATAIRTRYPQLHRRPELVALTLLAELGSLTAPFAVLAISLAARNWFVATISLVTCAILITLYGSTVRLTYRRFLWRGIWAVPFAPLYDVSLLNYSMWQYEFREVVWKGRNVCIPVMQSAGEVATSSNQST